MKNLLLIILVSFKITTIQAQIPSEEFDKAKMEYKGTKSAQARMLMRHIEIWGKITEKEAKLDTAFLNLLNIKVGVTKEELQKYLSSKNITNNEIGGDINSPVSHITVNGKKVFAKYFVIHDVSTPVFKTDFPSNINDES